MRIQPRNRKLGVLLSGRGSNFEALAKRIDDGTLNAEIAVVISNVEASAGLARARERGLHCTFLPSKGKKREQFDAEAVEILRSRDVSLVVLAGFMRILSPIFLEAFPYGILNIHPALLPSFPGLASQQQALEFGVKITGCTVHFVNDALDYGPIIRQAAVEIRSDDTTETLSMHIIQEEHRIYWEAIDLVLSGRCEISGRRVLIN